MQAVVQLHLSAIRSRKETEVVVLRYWKTTIFWSAKKPLVHADKGMVHLVVVEPDLYLYTLQALLLAYSSSRDTKQISSSSHTNL
jgi:hypothetical protein